jgi:hypothetical protein
MTSIASSFRLGMGSLLDHPRAERDADGRVSVGGYASDEALAALCARGCTPDRGYGVRVIVTEQPQAERWDGLRCQLQRAPGDPADRTCDPR